MHFSCIGLHVILLWCSQSQLITKKSMTMKKQIRKLAVPLLVVAALQSTDVHAQLGKLKDKLKEATGNKGSEQPVKVTTSEGVAGKVENPVNSVAQQAADAAGSSFAVIRKKYEAGKMTVVSNEDPKTAVTEVPAFLTFTNDYRKPEEDVKTFTGNDFVYATLKLPRKLTEYLPAANADDLEYYRVVVKAWPDYDQYRDVESNLKLNKKADFPLTYDRNVVLFGILPQQEFYDHFGEKYMKDEKFATPADAVKGYSAILANPIVFEIAEMMKNVPDGKQIIHVHVQITAKMRGSTFRRLEEIRGAFEVEVDNSAKERYAGIVEAMGEYKLSNHYAAELSIANQTISEAAEAEMLKNMSPRDRERYQIAKRSPDGYMAAYKGPKATITVQMDGQRGKEAKIWISWPDGGEGKEAGNSSFMLFPGATRSKTKQIPVGAKVTMNGRTLIDKVSGNQTVTVYWYY